MRLKIFRAASQGAAMAQVRSELGPDALILGVRRAGGGVEVTAALEAAETAARHPDVARLDALRWHGVPAALCEELALGEPEAALAGRFRFGSAACGQDAPPLLLAGPPGAGKTLTVARLATRLTLAGTPPVVISADAQRAGAAEQLAAFTRLLGLTLLAASDAVSLSRVISRRLDGAPVLIDTGGIDPFDPRAQAEIAGLADVAGASVALVLPAGGDAGECADMAAAFAAAGATALVATRMDVARRLGGILAAAGAGLILTEAGVGPDAADGLQPMTPALLARRLFPASRPAAGPGHRTPHWPAATARPA